MKIQHYMKNLLLLAILFASTPALHGQDTLPKIAVRSISNKVIVSWKSTYGANIAYINIQRSADSIKGFSTIGQVLEPNNKENGYVDSKPPASKIFYRVFVAFEGGTYVFSKSYRPVLDTVVQLPAIDALIEKQRRDSIKNAGLPPLPVVPKGWMPSKYIFTGRENNVMINLPQMAANKYSVQFFDEQHRILFEIKKLEEPFLVIEKVNFIRAGWYYFKLYENGKLLEKNQFYIPKDGRYGIPPAEQGKKIYE
jgi:hypothetical protein